MTGTRQTGRSRLGHRSLNTASIEQYVQLRELIASGGTRTAIAIIRAGLPAPLLVSLAEHFKISRREAFRLVGIKPATAERKIRNRDHLSADVSERLVRIADIERIAIEVLGSVEAAHRWLETPAVAFGGERPIEMTDTGYGATEVLRLLNGIRYGAVA